MTVGEALELTDRRFPMPSTFWSQASFSSRL